MTAPYPPRPIPCLHAKRCFPKLIPAIMHTLQNLHLSGTVVDVRKEAGLDRAAELFKVLGHESRLWLLRLLEVEESSVGTLAEATGMAQPLVSQHLRTLRLAGLVTSSRAGKEVIYRLADSHVAHVIADAIAHALEHPAASTGARE